IPVDIYELGLVYSVEVDPSGAVAIRMTLTSPACPVAGTLPPEVEAKVRNVPGVTDVKVEVVWDPPWRPAMMSEAARLQLNICPRRPGPGCSSVVRPSQPSEDRVTPPARSIGRASTASSLSCAAVAMSAAAAMTSPRSAGSIGPLPLHG